MVIKNFVPRRVSAAHNRGDAAAAGSTIRASGSQPRSAGFRFGKLRPIPALPVWLIGLKSEQKGDAECDLCELISTTGADVTEKARREPLLHRLESADKLTYWNWQSTA